jgi:hypothetical protein
MVPFLIPHFLLGEVPEAHPGALSVGVGFACSLVLDRLEEAVEPLREALAIVR